MKRSLEVQEKYRATCIAICFASVAKTKLPGSSSTLLRRLGALQSSSSLRTDVVR